MYLGGIVNSNSIRELGSPRFRRRPTSLLTWNDRFASCLSANQIHKVGALIRRKSITVLGSRRSVLYRPTAGAMPFYAGPACAV